MIRIAVAGALGRMGRTILTLVMNDPELKVTGALEQTGHPLLGQDVGPLLGIKPVGTLISANIEGTLKKSDVLIDFTHFSAVERHLKAVQKLKKGYVLGTTGLPGALMSRLKRAGKTIPIVQSPNMSIGVNLLFHLAEITAKALDENYDIEIAETHHRLKKDSPSGTAMKLLEIVAAARGRNSKKDTVFGRQGETGVRPRGQIGVLALRGGDVVGDHTVSFLADGERIELTHKASSRTAFAQGALAAAKFVAKKKTGFYTMQQVLAIV